MKLPFVRRRDYEAVLNALKLAIIVIDTLPADGSRSTAERIQRVKDSAK